MLIAVKTFSGKVIVRPDNTRVKDGEDVYMPEFVSRLEWTPVIYTRIIRPGRSISKKFADRYWDSFNVGILLFPADLIDGSEEGYACASCLDHSSLLNLEFHGVKEQSKEYNKIVISKNENVLFSDTIDVRERILNSIADVSRFCWLREGDLLAVEIRPREALCDMKNSPFQISGTMDGQTVFDKKIIL